ncbi:LysR family transcriptional regulator [Piscirickettsia salmonis]|uniref:CysJI operon transcriptional activator n=1 Tax=Piscirickettsia salmonis TaxID=1238 RepID=A0A9Q5YK14_PISSA|nr:LysR substrate-binding domain-containing protein [Piscirickettsia salmonis]RNC77200.1 LysR family transcriptional regulator [Piscirickettsiaceae bacterium NZ-RLO2]ALA25007.1 bacterial regulatory helix-turn-helix, lysR family protein [Piscirickettsia salmonis]APS45298.1 LysR family transcriptional regulator [Piscirickettsia salmonis]APS48658.1 LysR family transcriptional regulator [Piscirickettsia salmonis]APS49903.1 LysR family transcriptional regulator [Piscirickettsia salmonis]
MSVKITLRQLEIFVAISQHGHVTQAANSLYLSQSAVSMALAELERQLGKTLFDRAHKNLQLTNEGRLLLDKAVSLMQQAREVEQLFESDVQGELVVGASSTVGNYMLAGLMSEYLQKYPQLRLRLEISNTRRSQEKLLDYQFDCAFVEGEVTHADIKRQLWCMDEMLLIVAPTHPLAYKGLVEASDLSNAVWVLREQGSGTREFFNRRVLPELTYAQVCLELSDSTAIAQSVETGVGVSCLSRHVVECALREKRLAKLPYERKLERAFYLLIHKKKHIPALVHHFIDFCYQYIGKNNNYSL